MYDVLSTQAISNLVGYEFIVTLLIIIGVFKKPIAKFAGIELIIIFQNFSKTLSYLFTTPNVWKIVDHVPVTDFFILKDIMYLGFGITLYQLTNK